MNNNAYNLELFEPLTSEELKKQSEKRIKERRERLNRKKQVAIARKLAVFTLSFLIFVGSNILIIFNKMEIHTLMREKDAIEREIEVIKAENVRIRSEVKAKTFHSNIIKFAEEELGMIKADSSDITYINTMPEGDRIIISGDKTLKK